MQVQLLLLLELLDILSKSFAKIIKAQKRNPLLLKILVLVLIHNYNTIINTIASGVTYTMLCSSQELTGKLFLRASFSGRSIFGATRARMRASSNGGVRPRPKPPRFTSTGQCEGCKRSLPRCCEAERSLPKLGPTFDDFGQNKVLSSLFQGFVRVHNWVLSSSSPTLLVPPINGGSPTYTHKRYYSSLVPGSPHWHAANKSPLCLTYVCCIACIRMRCTAVCINVPTTGA